MARTATKRNNSRDGAVSVTTTSPTATTTSTSRQDRRSPYADRVSTLYNDENGASEQLNTPTKKRPSTTARQTQAKNSASNASIYDVPDDDSIDVFESSRKHVDRYLSVSSANKPRSRRRAVATAVSTIEEEGAGVEPPTLMAEDEENDDEEEEGQEEVQQEKVAAETEEEEPVEEDEPLVEAPVATPKKRGRPPKARFADRFESPVAAIEHTPTSKRRRTDAFATPNKATPTKVAHGGVAATPTTRRTLADRSARKKSTRALIDRMVAGGDDDDEDEEALNDAILDAEEDEDGDHEAGEPNDYGLGQDLPTIEEAPMAPTPKKRGRPPKAKNVAPATNADTALNGDALVKRGPGRPRKTDTGTGTSAAAARVPTPPRDLPAHEHYFYQNRAGAGIKTSNNTLSALRLLTYDEYFRLRDGGTGNINNRHEKEIGYLEELHAQSFAQWAFELSQGFSVCLYGYGSKQRVLRAFATALHKGIRDHDAHKIVMVNTSTAGVAVSAAAAAASRGGATAGLTASAAASTLRDIMLVIAAAAVGISTNGKEAAPKLPSGAAAAERTLLTLLDKSGDDDGSGNNVTTVTLIINGIDSPSLRRPAAQATLARIAAHHRVRLLCAADTPGFALLWDGAARSLQNFVFHDATTFHPLAGLDTVDEVHALLGRRVRRVGGKDGAAFVLRSLPENARTLFQLLVGEVLAADEGNGDGGGRGGGGYDNEDDDDNDGDADRDGGAAESVGMEYRMLYNKAVEEFICSSEMAFRTLLKEFHDHQMVTSRKDAFGTEMLSLPFRRDELEGLLEDLAS